MEEFNISNMNEESLSSLQSDQLVKIILALNKENENFKKTAEDIVAKRYDERLERLEREINKDKQYIRRETIEFSGISQDVGDDAIEYECLKILKAAKVKVGNRFPSTLDIHAAHRKGRKGIVILKFVNRKFAFSALSNRASLKNSNDYGNIFINQSLCPEFAFLNFAVRKAKRLNQIHFYKMKNGVTFIQKEADGRWAEISHVNDLEKNGIPVPDRSY